MRPSVLPLPALRHAGPSAPLTQSVVLAPHLVPSRVAMAATIAHLPEGLLEGVFLALEPPDRRV